MSVFKEFNGVFKRASDYLKKVTLLDLTSWFIFLLSISGIAGIVCLYFVKTVSPDWKGALQSAILWTTAISLFLYTRETRDLKRVTQKQLEETRKSTKLSLRPFIRLEWSNYSLYNNQTGLYHIKIVNEGVGLAVNLKVTFSHNPSSFIATVVGANRTYLSVTEPNYQDFHCKSEKEFIDSFSPDKSEYTITIEYADLEKNNYKQSFVTDRSLGYKFRITGW